ncbi:MAG TPA: hypothetical protein VFC19_16325 [Candidatus Limnocylindrales bacterium]|nr:hypothetical protein [Candidatus Limnocylindrales bacterium]
MLYVLALISLAITALAAYSISLLGADTFRQIYEDAGMNPTEAEQAASIASTFAYVGAAPWLVFAILYLILAIFVGKGKQWARITTWVIAGISALCCFGLSLAGNAANSALSGMSGQSGVDQGELARRIQDEQPDWLPVVDTALYAVGLLAAIVVIVLLLLPPSNPYFRRPEPQWTPPAYPAP